MSSSTTSTVTYPYSYTLFLTPSQGGEKYLFSRIFLYWMPLLQNKCRQDFFKEYKGYGLVTYFNNCASLKRSNGERAAGLSLHPHFPPALKKACHKPRKHPANRRSCVDVTGCFAVNVVLFLGFLARGDELRWSWPVPK